VYNAKKIVAIKAARKNEKSEVVDDLKNPMAVLEFPVKIGRILPQNSLEKCRRSKFRVRGCPPLRIEFGTASLVLRIVAVLASIGFCPPEWVR
jgi:hypothetical protein